MLMKSRKQFQMRAVTAGTARLTFLILPEGEFRTSNVVFAGANRFARGSQHEHLGWPPETVFVEYGPLFTKNPGSLGYAKPMSFRGHLVSVNLIKNNAERELAIRLQRDFIGAEIKAFRRWLKTKDHPHCADWSQQVRQLERGITAFSNHKLGYFELLQTFISTFDQGSTHQNERTKARAELSDAIRDRYLKQLNARLPVAILVINVNHVEYYNYSDARDIEFNTEKEDTEHRKSEDLQQFMFLRVPQQKAQFEREHIPFYDPQWLATQQARNQPIWYPEQLDHFHLKL